ncbi:hypothetical protein RCN48_11730 [Escherichia marmotae]|nr:hypothetical protein [Escherichia marmotae]MED9358604.1 hypothetical protein [Escherichia marmotae]
MKTINTTVTDSTIIIPSTNNHPTTLEKKGMNSLLTENITKNNRLTVLECQNQNVDETTEESLPFFNQNLSYPSFAKTNVSPEYITQYLQLADTYNDMDSLNQAILLANNSTKLVSNITKDPDLEKDLSAQIADLIAKLTDMDNVFSQLKSDFLKEKAPATRESSESDLISSDGGLLSCFSAIPAKVNQQVIDLFVCILRLSLSRLESDLNISSELSVAICSMIDSRCQESVSQAKKKMWGGIAKSVGTALGAVTNAISTGVAVAKSANVEVQVNNKQNTMADFQKNVTSFCEKYGLVEDNANSITDNSPKQQIAQLARDLQSKLTPENPDWQGVERNLTLMRSVIEDPSKLNSLEFSTELKNSLASDVKLLGTMEEKARVVVLGSTTSLSNDEIMANIRDAHLRAQVNSQAVEASYKLAGDSVGNFLDYSATATEDVNMAQLEKNSNRLEAIEAQIRQDEQQITNTIASVQSLLEKAEDSGTRSC